MPPRSDQKTTALGKARRLLRYPARQWPSLAGIVAMTAAISAVIALEPWPLKILVDYALGDLTVPGSLRSIVGAVFPAGPSPAVLVIVAALASLILFAATSALDVALSMVSAAAGQRMIYDLAADLFHRLQRLSLQYHARRRLGDSLSRLTEDTWCVFTLTEAVLVSPGRQLLTLITVGALAWTQDPGLTAIAFLAAPVLAVSSLLFGPRLKSRARQTIEAMSSLLCFVHETLTAIPIVQAFGAEARNSERFRRLAQDAVIQARTRALLVGAYGLVNGITGTIGMAVILYVGGQRVLSGSLTVGSLLVFLAYMRTIQYASGSLLGTYGALKAEEARMDRVLEILDADEAVRERPGARAIVASNGRGRVGFERVTFGYEAGRPVLHEVTLEACPGETVALVGATGAGKSTLVSLVPRFFDPWQGRVTFDGVDVRDLKLSSLRSQVALVLQEPYLLPLGVAENVSYGRPGAGREEIEAAAVAANADEFIRRLPAGYDTVLGERGATLSGGEKQRLAIARAFLKDAPVLVLDEPTSALDAETESQLMAALERLMRGRTTFIVAHRLSTIRRADRIVVLEEGRVVETGSHVQLLDSGGPYSRFHDLQLAGSRNDGAGRGRRG